MISQRTKEGLKAARARGAILGSTGRDRAKENQAKADQKARELAELIRQFPEDQRQTVTSLTRELSARKIPAPRGGN